MSSAKIISETNNGVKVCACAGTISTRPGTALEIWEARTDGAKNLNLVEKIVASGHKTVIEHHYFNIALENVSVFVEQFLIEFRLAAFTVKSRRYVNFSNAGYNLPSTLTSQQKQLMQTHIESMFSVYRQLVEGGIAVEDARFVLPYAFASNIYLSVNTCQLLHIICNMIYGRGKHFEEIYNLGMQLKTQLEQRYPNIVEREKPKYKDYDLNLSPKADDREITFTTATTKVLQAPSEYNQIMAAAATLMGVEFDGKKTATDGKQARFLEQFNFTIQFNNITLSTLTHLVRHRIQSILVPYLQAFPYSYNFIMPPKIEENAKLKDLYIQAITENRQVFEQLLAIGTTNEQLIYITLSGSTQTVISTINARQLAHMFKLRTCTRAQWEIMDLMRNLLSTLCASHPDLFKNMGASCFVDGYCPEGRFTCGKIKEVQQWFAELTGK